MNESLTMSILLWSIILCIYMAASSWAREEAKRSNGTTPTWTVPGVLLLWGIGFACVAGLASILAYPFLYLMGVIG